LSKPKSFPGPAKFFIEGALYVPYVLDEQKTPGDEFLLGKYNGPLDCHCVGCGRASVFHRSSSPPIAPADARYFTCVRSGNHELIFYYLTWSETPERSSEEIKEVLEKAEVGKPLPPGPPTTHYAMKIGQWPSLADLASERVGRYRSVLSEKQYVEFNRGVGLHAHDVGIGSFVYLRRIFEDLVEEAHAKAKVDAKWNEDLFQRSRMEEKILLLSSHLPRTLVENRKVYSILSVGIHDLEEEECAALFPVVQAGIELVLEEKIAEGERVRREKEVKRAIEAASQEISERKS